MSSKLLETLKKEKEVRKKLKNAEKTDEKLVKNFSWVLYFAGKEFNQSLENDVGTESKVNTIDFGQLNNSRGEQIEKIIKELYKEQQNAQLADDSKYPIIWFKNIDKITEKSPLENALLPIFDPQQNTELFNKEVDLSKYILIATSSTREMAQLSLPLNSRLDVINVETVKPRQFFLDKYFTWISIGSILLTIILGLFAFWPNKKDQKEEK